MLKDMSHPEQAGNPVGAVPPPPPSWDYPPPPPPSWDYPPPGAYSPQLGYPPPPGFYHDPTAYRDPTAPYGRDQLTGQPLSDKSKVIAGLLQLIGVFGLVGFGRIYLGQTGYGIIQLVVGILTCGIGAVIWGIIDAVLIFSGSVTDKVGRPLRNGT